MKVYVQIIDTRSGISQYGMIEELIQKGFEVDNALGHFGVNTSTVEWAMVDATETYEFKFGTIKGTTKVVNILSIWK